MAHNGGVSGPLPSLRGRLPESLRSRYRTGIQLGQGLSSEVFRGRRRHDAREVVLKVFRAPPAGTPGRLRERFHREVRLLEAVDHPGVVQVLDHGLEEDLCYVVYEYLEGETLRASMRAQGAWPPGRVVPLLDGILAALEALAGAGIVHRDLKPENVLVGPGGRPLVFDLGLSRAVGAETMLTATGEFLGTPTYAAPEQILGQDPDGRDDLYSLGIMAHELLAGEHPFYRRGMSMDQVLRHQLELVPASPCVGRPEVPAWLGDLVGRLMEKRRSDRPADAAAVRAALGAGARGGEAGAPPEAAPPGAGRPGAALPPAAPTPRRALAAPAGPGATWVRGRTPALVLAATLGLGAVLGRRGGAPVAPAGPALPATSAAPAPAPRPPDPPGEAVIQALADELALREPDADPATWGRIEGLQPVRALVNWVRAGGDPDQLSLARRERLAALDRSFEAEGLGRPLHPFYGVRGEAGEVDLGAARRRHRLGDSEASPRSSRDPWVVTALRRADAARASLERLEDALRRRGVDVLPARLRDGRFAFYLQMAGGDAWKLVSRLLPDPRGRVVVAALLRPIEADMRAAVYAAGRSLVRGEPPEDVALFFHDLLGQAPVTLAGGLLGGDPDLLVEDGGTPASALLRGRLWWLRNRLRREAGLPLEGGAGREAALWRQAEAGLEAGGAALGRRRRARFSLVSLLVVEGDDAGMRALVPRWRQVLAREQPDLLPYLLAKAVEVTVLTGTRDRWPAGELEGLAAAARPRLGVLADDHRARTLAWLAELDL